LLPSAEFFRSLLSSLDTSRMGGEKGSSAANTLTLFDFVNIGFGIDQEETKSPVNDATDY